MRQGRVDDAVREYAEAVKMLPALADLRVNYGMALERANRPADAEAQYREAIRLRPPTGKALYHLANWLSSTGKDARRSRSIVVRWPRNLAHKRRPSTMTSASHSPPPEPQRGDRRVS
jgi:Tfp pilus assembly protein PilF